MGLSANALAKELKVTPARINDIVRERRGITADTALRLARYFGTDARSWLNLQAAYDLRIAELSQAKNIAGTIRPRAVCISLPPLSKWFIPQQDWHYRQLARESWRFSPLLLPMHPAPPSFQHHRNVGPLFDVRA